MIIKIFFIAAILILIIIVNSFAQNSLSGKITDAKDATALVGATVSITSLKTGSISDQDGNYFIQNLPAGNYLVQVTYLGYVTLAKNISVNGNVTQNFAMTPSVVEAQEVVITGVAIPTEVKRATTPIEIISKQKLLEIPSTNLIDAVAKQPGISAVSTGPGVSKPQIRGLGYNRLVVLSDGIRQEGQQWGDEHGIEIDEYAASKVEVLKGPGSIIYGSDAIAGVINILSPDPPEKGVIKGSLLGNYQTNNGLIGYSASVIGNERGFVWLARYSGKFAHDYQNNLDGFVYNSGFKEQDGSGYIGLNEKWGYSHINFSIFHELLELPEGERDSTGAFIKPVIVNDSTLAGSEATDADFHSYSTATPHQLVRHYKVGWMNNIVLGESKLYFNIGYENNQRQEFANPLSPNQYGLYFFLNSVPYDVRFTLPEMNGWNITVGTNGMYQKNENRGTEFLVPAYHLFDAGLFAFAQKNFDKLSLSGGVRYDHRSITTETLYLDENELPVDPSEPGAVLKFQGTTSNFSAVSGSIGASYKVSEQSVFKLNVSKGFRAPNIAEIGANGRHEGTFRYEIGNPNLKAENSLQFDGGYALNTEHVTASINIFDNLISNFIFPEKVSSVFGGDSLIVDPEEGSSVPVYKYTQGNANLYGGEVSIDIHPHPLDWLHFENSFSYVSAIQRDESDSTKYLPFTPAPRFQSELKCTSKRLGKGLRNSFVAFGIEYDFDQNHVYSAYNTETPTPGYTLLDASMGTDVYSKDHQLFSVYFTGSNLADVVYQSHLSRLKYAPENPVTGSAGIYNMGRNFSIKMNIPIDF